MKKHHRLLNPLRHAAVIEGGDPPTGDTGGEEEGGEVEGTQRHNLRRVNYLVLLLIFAHLD